KYSPPPGYIPTMANPLLEIPYEKVDLVPGCNRVVTPFMTCGDFSGFDSHPKADAKGHGVNSQKSHSDDSTAERRHLRALDLWWPKAAMSKWASSNRNG
ncbi:tRNA (uridine-2'-O-)-methyltransferase trm7, partial [Spiromyces aspiralis]